MYKNSYKHSSWLTLLQDRVSLGKKLMSSAAIQCTAIDDVECYRLRTLLENIFGSETAVVGVRTNPHGRLGTNGFSLTHEYALFSRTDENEPVGLLPRNEKQNARYKEVDEKGQYLWFPMIKTGSNTLRENRPTMFYPIYLNLDTYKMRIPQMTWDESKQEFIIHDQLKPNEKEILPIKEDGVQGCWYFGVDRAIKEVNDFKVIKNKNGTYSVYVKYRATEGLSPFTFWDDAKYSATEHGTNLLKDIFGEQQSFSYPKSNFLVEDCLRVLKAVDNEIVLDYFAGSGTTGHAVIDLNRSNKNNIRYCLVEVNEYFNTVTKPRIKKNIYSKDWKNGKPVSRKGISQCFKYIRLEQYEDTLNNLVVAQPANLFDTADDTTFKESYMLGYMMDTETRSSLFNVEWFVNPFAMTLKTTKDNELVETAVDMVETFNFLIGLRVETEHWHMDGNICVVEGVTHRTHETALVIWRNCEKVDNDALNRFFCKMDYSTLAHDFDVIYVNGDNTLPNLRRDDDRWKVVLIEEEFKNRMFEEE